MYKLPPLDDAPTAIRDFAASTPSQPMPRTRSKRARCPESGTASADGADPDGDAYFQRLIKEQIRFDVADENPPSEAEDEILHDDGGLSVGTVDSSDGDVPSKGSSVRDTHDPDDVALDNVLETEVRDAAPRDEIAIAEGEEENNPPPPALLEGELLNLDIADVADLPHVKGRSLLHHHTRQKNIVFLSLDLETGGRSVASSSSPVKSFAPRSPGTGTRWPRTLCPRLHVRGSSTIPKPALGAEHSTHM